MDGPGDKQPMMGENFFDTDEHRWTPMNGDECSPDGRALT
jgi:hypothetical protein